MKFPSINKQPLRSVNVPEISGGMNLRDSLTMIQDNQLTDSKNVWFKENILKTRPGITYKGYVSGIAQAENLRVENAVKVENGNTYRLISYLTDHTTQSNIHFVWVDENGISQSHTDTIICEQCISNQFVVQFKKDLYCFAKNRGDTGGVIYRKGEENTWVEVTDCGTPNGIYVPTVYTSCLYVNNDGFKGTQFEGFNLLSSKFKMIYSSVNRELLDASNPSSSHDMNFVVPFAGEAAWAIADNLKLTITHRNGIVATHTAVGSGTEWIEPNVNIDGLEMHIGRIADNKLLISFTDASGSNFKKVTISDYLENNVEIIAPFVPDTASTNKVFNMSQNIWFGGDALGISGGTRLFLCGNKTENENNLVIWSGLNKPLYFPENGYAYVGNSNQAVTAFGRQNDTLVIFKEQETFYTQYMRNGNITANDLIDQKVVDYSTSSVYFPIIQLHSAIGCDCPNSVQLCRNRLVWANSDGSVYTLVTENQYSERNIYPIGDMIKRKLKTEQDLKNAYSCDWNGHYLLFAGSHVYVMNYESYGYVYASGYSKTDDAQVKIPWWYWELPNSADETIKTAFLCGSSPICIYETTTGQNKSLTTFTFEEDKITDTTGIGRPIDIPSFVITKIFDFNAPHHTKNVPLFNISFGNNGGKPINVSVITENGQKDEEIIELSESNQNEYSPDYVHNREFRPCIRLINRMGIRIECVGAMSIDSISLNYRILGGAR